MNKIWALIDDRAGNTSQTLGIANALNGDLKIINIKYNKFISLPNFTHISALLFVNKNYKKNIKAPWPDIVISAGRRLAPVAAYIKKQNPSTFIVHLMNPQMRFSKFDIVILPEHDVCENKNNVIRIIGAPHCVTNENLAVEKKKWEDKIKHLPSPRITVLVGGNTKYGRITLQDTEKLISSAMEIAGNGSLLISTSRRTPATSINLISSIVRKFPHYLYRYENSGDNPYLGFLSLADKILVTGESISMCSEACYTGKTVYIFSTTAALGNKYRDFMQSLYNKKYAFPIKDWLPEDNSAIHNIRLDETKRIVRIIMQRLKKENN